jgi:hypothetical protein
MNPAFFPPILGSFHARDSLEHFGMFADTASKTREFVAAISAGVHRTPPGQAPMITVETASENAPRCRPEVCEAPVRNLNRCATPPYKRREVSGT